MSIDRRIKELLSDRAWRQHALRSPIPSVRDRAVRAVELIDQEIAQLREDERTASEHAGPHTKQQTYRGKK